MPDALKTSLPVGACDCHAHVFGPFDRFPLSDKPPYVPPEAPRAAYRAMLDDAGFSRGVLVHAGANGWDNRATLDAIAADPERLRGVCVPSPAIDSDALAALDAGGMRGVRFTQVRVQPQGPQKGRLDLVDLRMFAARLDALEWHAQVWCDIDTIAENEHMFRSLGISLVFDHSGFFDVARGVDAPSFKSLLRLVGDGIAWVKLTVFRNSKSPPDFDDVKAHHDALIRANPERMLWGSDWPFLGMKGDAAYSTPRLISKALEWWSDEKLARRILVTNPEALYGFPSVAEVGR